MSSPFTLGQWIWTPETWPNHYALFVRTVTADAPISTLTVLVTASHYYELWVNGQWMARGPVPGDPHWCQYDEVACTLAEPTREVQVVLLAHHVDCPVISLLPAPGGVIAELRAEGLHCGTDSAWACLTLPMWQQQVPKRGWALGYAEDYDAAGEPAGWPARIFTAEETAAWPHAVPVAEAETIWTGYQARMTPPLEYRFIAPTVMTAYHAPGPTVEGIGEASAYHDTETLIPLTGSLPFSLATLNAQLASANALTFDLGKEYIGHYVLEFEAPAAMVIELSGAELLREGRPWIYRKGTSYTARYRTRAGYQTFIPFFWSGFRYLHLVIRGETAGVIIHQVGCRARSAPLTPVAPPALAGDPALAEIYRLCERTLQRGVQEHLIDCPTREQAQYWGDAVFIAQSLWRGFNAPSYLEWYLACFLLAPLTADGLLSSVYPGAHQVFLDYALIPLLGQRFYRQNTGNYYQPREFLEKALQLKRWYDVHRNTRGLVEAPSAPAGSPALFAFIDHPGLGWHNFPHPGIDRGGASCPLNLFFLMFVQMLAEMGSAIADPRAQALRGEANALADTIRHTFDDGVLLHDAHDGAMRSPGTSWQTNSLAVYADLLTGKRAEQTMRALLDGYDTLCRCSPYFHFFFLPALRKVGMDAEARALIVREWSPMLAGGATLTWEGFLGDEKDSLCHPWSTAPFLYLLDG